MHSDEPSSIWRITPDGKRTLLDQGLHSASGIAFSPDGSLLFAAERTGSRVYSFVSAAGDLRDKEAYYWLHAADMPQAGGPEELAVDLQGDLYAATPMGIQVCDQPGRVNAILPLPKGRVTDLCFGGEHFDTLFATCGDTVFKRRLRTTGANAWAEPNLPPVPHL